MLALGLGVVVALNGRRILPARYFFDAQEIHDLATTSNSSVSFASPSFGAVAALYRIVGLADNPILAGLVTYAAAALVIFLAFRAHSYRITVLGAVASSLALVVAGVYLGTYSKDLFVLPISIVAITARRGWQGHAALVIAMVLYAQWFRSYWYLTVGLYLIFLAVSALRIPRPALFALPVAALVAIAVAAYVGIGIDSDFARTTVNHLRQGTLDARTTIRPFVSLPGAFSPLVNTVLTFLTLIVPVPLLAMGQAYYIGAALMLTTIWAMFGLGAWATSPGTVGRRCMLVALAFLTTQALFEPDYGSVLRHTAPLMGVIVYCALVPTTIRSLGNRARRPETKLAEPSASTAAD